jgi:RNA 2',3'-cyclic 3'-phosphodiesterase
MARLFFAIWPGAAAARELARVGESLAGLAGGRPMPAEKIHLTLAFLGSLDEDAAGKAAVAAGEAGGAEIRMTIDGVGSFRKARVAWAAPGAMPPGLVEWQARLAQALRARDFTLEDRPFTPHVTLVRKLEKPVPHAPMPPIEWRSRALTLVESTGAGRYEVVESWGLSGG